MILNVYFIWSIETWWCFKRCNNLKSRSNSSFLEYLWFMNDYRVEITLNHGTIFAQFSLYFPLRISSLIFHSKIHKLLSRRSLQNSWISFKMICYKMTIKYDAISILFSSSLIHCLHHFCQNNAHSHEPRNKHDNYFPFLRQHCKKKNVSKAVSDTHFMYSTSYSQAKQVVASQPLFT